MIGDRDTDLEFAAISAYVACACSQAARPRKPGPGVLHELLRAVATLPGAHGKPLIDIKVDLDAK